ncbi:MAG: ABC transporter substrate-binding protein [Gammaproteobacteria bacterium HGW-Gammaproteobacteria-11]|nr:MAG: ABC transporter substrate-binding protein [Gammaproteobacteria bacterium HGW-Gammaproteobacteria-11]
MKYFLVSISIWALLPVEALHAASLNWGFSPTDPPPYVVTRDGQLGNSLTRAIGERVAQELGWQLQFVDTPNARIDEALETGRIDLICNTQPDWHARAEHLLWTNVLYHDADVLVVPEGEPAPHSVSALHGKIVGTSLGYHYAPALTEAFDKGLVQRLDVRDIETRLRMLQRGRLHASVDLRRAVSHLIRQHRLEGLRVSQWSLEEMALSCVIGIQEQARAEQLRDVINRLQEEGEINELVSLFD